MLGIAMRFDLVDLQLFIAVADARSITGGALRAHLALASASARIKGLEAAFGAALLKRGRRGIELTAAGESLLDHARIIMHNVDAMRGDLPAFARGMKATRASARQYLGPVGISAEGAGGLSAPSIRMSASMSRSAKAPISRSAIASGAADLGFAAEHALPDSIERFPFSEDRLVLVAARARRTGRAAGRSIFSEVVGPRLRRTDRVERAARRISPATRRGSARACDFARGSTISMRSARWWRPASASR